MMNSVHNLPTNVPTESPMEQISSVIPSVIPLVKMTRHHFFLLCFNFFSHGNSLGIYRGNIFVGKIPRKFIDGNIASVFPFVFIDFLVVKLGVSKKTRKLEKNNQKNQTMKKNRLKF
jgi:hypothetical protein